MSNTNKASKNSQKKEKIFHYLKLGLFKKDAALMAGISEKTLYRWLAEDDSFDSRVEASILEYKQALIKILNIHAVKNGMLALKILETRWPKEWAVKKMSLEDSQQDDSIHKLVETIDKIYKEEVKNQDFEKEQESLFA